MGYTKAFEIDGEGDGSERPVWQEKAGRPFVGRSAAVGRIERILAAIRDESWLPLGLRTLLAEEVTSLRDELCRGEITLEQVGERVHGIALSSFAYREVVMRSEAVTQLRVLDLELNPDFRLSASIAEA